MTAKVKRVRKVKRKRLTEPVKPSIWSRAEKERLWYWSTVMAAVFAIVLLWWKVRGR